MILQVVPSASPTPSTRTRLLDAAARLFLQQGYADTAMEQVRLAAGASNGSLYHHFPTKALLAQALYAHTLRDFHAALLPAIAQGAGAQAGVTALVRAHIAWVVRHPDRAALLHQLKRHGDVTDASAAVSAANAEAFAALKAWTTAKAQAGEMRALPFYVWMAVVFAPVLSLSERWLYEAAPGDAPTGAPHATGQPTGKPNVTPAVRAALAHAAWSAVAP